MLDERGYIFEYLFMKFLNMKIIKAHLSKLLYKKNIIISQIWEN